MSSCIHLKVCCDISCSTICWHGADILYASYLLVGMFIEAAQVKYLAQCLTAVIEPAALLSQVQFPNHNQFAPLKDEVSGRSAATYTTQTVIYSVSDIMLRHATD